MDSKNETKENSSEQVNLKSSIEDFLRELEEKEKDLNMSDEMVIEIDEDAVEEEISEFLTAEFLDIKTPFRENSYSQINAQEISPAVVPQVSAEPKKIISLEKEVSDLKTTLVGRQMDFENFRKRMERERSETFQNQITNLATQMLPVLDNLNRALDAASHFEAENSNDFRQFFDGIVLVNQQLNEVLSEMGVQPVVTVGEAFDPNYHDAVATQETNEFPPNTITEELLRGYRIGNKLIRAAMVKVASPVS
ncbi:MAG: nucleotide exchange factor GrpE [Pyrinomonadaceae bacterium]